MHFKRKISRKFNKMMLSYRLGVVVKTPDRRWHTYSTDNILFFPCPCLECWLLCIVMVHSVCTLVHWYKKSSGIRAQYVVSLHPVPNGRVIRPLEPPRVDQQPPVPNGMLIRPPEPPRVEQQPPSSPSLPLKNMFLLLLFSLSLHNLAFKNVVNIF